MFTWNNYHVFSDAETLGMVSDDICENLAVDLLGLYMTQILRRDRDIKDIRRNVESKSEILSSHFDIAVSLWIFGVRSSIFL